MADKGWVISLVEFFASSKAWLVSLLIGNMFALLVFMAEGTFPFQRIFLFVKYYCGRFTYLILMIVFAVIFYLILSGIGYFGKKFISLKRCRTKEFKKMLKDFDIFTPEERKLIKTLLRNGNKPIYANYDPSMYPYALGHCYLEYFNKSNPEYVGYSIYMKSLVSFVENYNYRRLKRYFKGTGKINNLGN